MSGLPNPDDKSYCWVIVFASMLGLFASLGLGRFSLGMMLPAMGEGLALTYSEMGLISTANFCGYLGAVLLSGKLAGRIGARFLVFLALVLVGGSMVLIGTADGYLAILLLYLLTGIGSALSNVPIMALISTWFEPARRGRAAGLCVMGNGLGLLVSGKAVPLLNTQAMDWRLSWLVLGAVVVLISVVCLLLLRNGPRSQGVSPAEGGDGRSKASSAALFVSPGRPIAHCAAIYFLFGFTYVIYITFMVTFLVEELGFGERQAGELWSWVGVLSLGSGPLLGYISDRFSRRVALMLVFATQAAAYLLVAADLPTLSVYLSIGCFGLVAWSVPTVMAALVGDYAGPKGAAAAFGLVTFAFGIGQIGGPALAGVLAEMSGSFRSSFALAAALVLVALVLSRLLKTPATLVTTRRSGPG